MAEEPEKSGREPNLELPSLRGFGRRKGRKSKPDPEPVATQDLPLVEETDPLAAEPVPAEPVPAEPVPVEPVAAPPTGGLTPSAGAAKRLPPTPPPPRRVPVVEPPPVVAPPPMREELVSVPPEPAPVVETLAPPEPEPVVKTVAPPEPLAEPATEQTMVVTEPVRPESPGVSAPAPEPAPEPVARRSAAERLPVLAPRIAAAVTGALVGLVGVALAFASGRGCEAVRGVGSCGGLGLFALLVILAIEVVLGAVLLKIWRLSDPTSTSFLGVGLAAVFVLLFLLSSLDSVWMALVIPVLTAVSYLVSLWVTNTIVDGIDTA